MLTYISKLSNKVTQYNPNSVKDSISALNRICSEFVLKQGDECYFLCTEWIEKTLNASSTTISNSSANTIDNISLVDFKTGKIKNGLKFKKDFRLVDKNTWEYIFRMFGATLVLYCIVPESCKDSESGRAWIEHTNFSAMDVKIIHPAEEPIPLVHDHIDDSASTKSNEKPILIPVKKILSGERESLMTGEINVLGYDVVKSRKDPSKLAALFVIQVIPPPQMKKSPWEVKREFAEFQELNNLLKKRKRTSKARIPLFPSEVFCLSLQSFDSKFLETRRSQLEGYLHILLVQEGLWESQELNIFLSAEVLEFNRHSLKSKECSSEITDEAPYHSMLELTGLREILRQKVDDSDSNQERNHDLQSIQDEKATSDH